MNSLQGFLVKCCFLNLERFFRNEFMKDKEVIPSSLLDFVDLMMEFMLPQYFTR